VQGDLVLVKRLIKVMLHSVGLDPVRYVAEFERPVDILTLVVEKYLETQKPFFFVQIGANDGIQDDPLRKLILRHKFCGLLVEPITLSPCSLNSATMQALIRQI
jgi:hypothetical protein